MRLFLLFKIRFQILSRVGIFTLCNFFGRSLSYNRTTLVPALLSEVYNVVGNLYHVQIMFNVFPCSVSF